MAVIENEAVLRETAHNYGDALSFEGLQCFQCGQDLMYPFIYWRGVVGGSMRYACFHPGCAADVVMGLSCDIHQVKHLTDSGLVFMRHNQTTPAMLMPRMKDQQG
jgi:hypothetical protein